MLWLSCSLGNDDEIITYHTIVNGTIIDEETKLPIEDVKVDLDLTFSLFYSRFKGRAYTNNSGKFNFEDYYTPGEKEFFASYNLDIDKKGYYGKSDYGGGIIKGQENDITIELTPWPTEFHTIATGRFLESGTEKPIENINFYFLRNVSSPAVWDTAMVTQSDNNGYFKVEDHYTRKPEEEYPKYALKFHIDGYDMTHNILNISANQKIHYNDQHLKPL